jgi:hypothetical protein
VVVVMVVVPRHVQLALAGGKWWRCLVTSGSRLREGSGGGGDGGCATSRPARVCAKEVVVVPTRVCTREEEEAEEVGVVVPRQARLAFARGRWWW